MSIDRWIDLFDAAAPALAGVSLIAAAAIAPALLGGLALRRRPDLRHAAGLAALAVAILSPALFLARGAIPRPPRPTLPVAEKPTESDQPPGPAPSLQPTSLALVSAAAPTTTLASAPTAIREDRQPAPAATAANRAWPSRTGALPSAAWLLGSLVAVARLGLGLVRVARLRRDTRPFDDAATLARTAEALGVAPADLPPVALSSKVDQPLTFGIVSPLVLLPTPLVERLSPDALRDVLVHECAHALRRDALVGLFQRLATAMHWPNPLIHALNRLIDTAREDLCDNHALRAARPSAYAASLLAVAELHPSRPAPMLALPIVARRGSLEARVTNLVDPRRTSRTHAPRLATAAVVVAGLAAGLVTAAQFGEAAQSKARPISPTSDRIVGQVVDEAGVPQPGTVVVCRQGYDRRRTAHTADAQGRFAIEIDVASDFASWHAESADGLKRSSEAGTRLDYDATPPDGLRLVLRPTSPVKVRVTDADRRPVADAVVFTTMADFPSGRSPRTDARGEATLRLPVGEWTEGVLAFKPGVGLDAYERDWGKPGLTPKERIDLVLDGAQAARFRVLDSAGRPVPGVPLVPSTINLDTTHYTYIIALCPEARVKTDGDGLASFDYIPRTAIHRVRVAIASPEYRSILEDPAHDVRRPEGVTDVVLVRETPATGRVFAPDGSPAAGVTVKAHGRNNESEIGHTTRARTADDGSYRLKLFPERAYSVSVEDERFAARTRMQVIPPEGATPSGLDLHLIPGVLLQGRATDEEGRPAADKVVSVFEEGGPAHIPSVGGHPGHRPYWNQERAGFSRHTRTDGKGRYHIRIPPGSYRLPLKNNFWEEPTKIGDQAEFVYDYGEPARKRHFIKITVRRAGPGGEVVPDAHVEATGGRGQAWFRYRGTVDGQGGVQAEWTVQPQAEPVPIFLYARSPDGSLAGFAAAGPEDAEATIVVGPATSIRGRVVHRDGGAPVPSARVSVSMGPPATPDSRVFLDVYCDPDGRFSVAGVPVGCRVKVDAAPNGNEAESRAEFDVRDAVPVDLPDLSLLDLDPNF